MTLTVYRLVCYMSCLDCYMSCLDDIDCFPVVGYMSIFFCSVYYTITEPQSDPASTVPTRYLRVATLTARLYSRTLFMHGA
jgi:hypothetical protein